MDMARAKYIDFGYFFQLSFTRTPAARASSWEKSDVPIETKLPATFSKNSISHPVAVLLITRYVYLPERLTRPAMRLEPILGLPSMM